MTDRRDIVEAFVVAFADAFESRAIEVAESQCDKADGIVRERWQHVIDACGARIG
ncbi:hypothetical protein K7957_10240 [Sphingomonas yunnanensis]|uniref:hypothetical protein n=1 Tax=Sphingomonas yunnanensis TaxID=310400 RepID=UPI001CA712C6|nr:hypothetical protein [Sphingomonas yunnanensis]MBY9063309.1 hypothetical protein [Sphingomonas yunnanensis]